MKTDLTQGKVCPFGSRCIDGFFVVFRHPENFIRIHTKAHPGKHRRDPAGICRQRAKDVYVSETDAVNLN